MQNRIEEEVLEKYKNTDHITRDQMWIRFPALRKAFDEIAINTGNKWLLSINGFLTDRYTKEK